MNRKLFYTDRNVIVILWQFFLPRCLENSRVWPPPDPEKDTTHTWNMGITSYTPWERQKTNLEWSEGQVKEYFIVFRDWFSKSDKDHVVDPEERDQQQSGFGQPPKRNGQIVTLFQFSNFSASPWIKSVISTCTAIGHCLPRLDTSASGPKSGWCR